MFLVVVPAARGRIWEAIVGYARAFARRDEEGRAYPAIVTVFVETEVRVSCRVVVLVVMVRHEVEAREELTR